MPTAGMRWTEHASEPLAPSAGTPRLPLRELRRARHVTQVELARRLNVSQASISKVEKGRPSIATVRRYVEALGGELELRAVFPEETLAIDV